jgi:hypothetical protein
MRSRLLGTRAATRVVFSVLLVVGWRPSLAAAQSPGTPEASQASHSQPASQPEARFDYRVGPLADLWLYVRANAAERAGSKAPPEFDAAIAAAKALDAQLGGHVLMWEPLDLALLTCRTAAELKRFVEDLPEAIPARGGRTLAIRSEALALADALVAVERVHRERVWPEHEAALRAALRRIDQQFRPKEAACVRYMLASLAMADPGGAVPVVLVSEAPWPGAYTVGRPAGAVACFVSVLRDQHAGTWLFETILHEATHAFDLKTQESGSVLIALREKLRAAGVGPADRDLRDIPHTIMFIQAGETIRRLVDPGHEHYGDAAGLYERSQRIVDVERPAWLAYLDGKQDREATVEQIVRELRP